MESIAITSQYDIELRKDIVKRIAGINDELNEEMKKEKDIILETKLAWKLFLFFLLNDNSQRNDNWNPYKNILDGVTFNV